MQDVQQVYQAHFLDVYRYALALCGDKALAEDLAQDTFLKAMDALHRFRGECELRTWLCRIARNQYISHLRKTGRVLPLPEVPDCGPWEELADTLHQRDEEERALRAAESLPEPARQVVFLRALSGLPFARIASLYGKTENWACVTYHRALKKLKDALEEHHEAGL